MLAFSNDYYGFIFRATQSVELFCAYLFFICIGILLAFCMSFIVFIRNVDFNGEANSIPEVIQFISVCVTFLGLIVGLLQIITKYVFPENEEEYITRIVELIQNNDLENKKENIKVHVKANNSENIRE